MMLRGSPGPSHERPPARLPKLTLPNLLNWYIKNLCEPEFYDPRGYRVLFTPERFPHLIKLRKRSGIDVNEPSKAVSKILAGRLTDSDFGGYDAERASGLSWIAPIVLRPSKVMEVSGLFGKAGDTLLVKEFQKTGFRFKVFICRRAGPRLLVPVTSHPRQSDSFPWGHFQVWP